jgi:hypothetical protein
MEHAASNFLTADQLLVRWNNVVTKGALANWRASKPQRGPAFVKIGGRVLYPVDKVADWEKLNLHAANDNGEGQGK